MVKKWIPEGDSYTEVRVGCSSSCLRVEIADCSLSEGVKDGKTNMFLPQKVYLRVLSIYLSILVHPH